MREMQDRWIKTQVEVDDTPMQGPLEMLAACFKRLMAIGPHFGYYPEPEKSFAICPQATEARVLAAFGDAGLTVQARQGHRYVGGFIGSREMRDRWIEPQVEKWVTIIEYKPAAATGTLEALLARER